jgi:uncharacterized membrane protein (DUF4010 family)
MAKQAKEANSPHLYSGSILMASGVMYFRFLVLIGLFNAELFHRLLPSFLVLGAIGTLGGWAWSLRPDEGAGQAQSAYVSKNPLELAAAFSLAILFAFFLVATNFAVARMGNAGIYGMAAITGLAPVDPFIMGLTQTAGKLTPLGLAAGGVVVAAASNNFAKAIIAEVGAGSKTGRQGLILLLALTALGMLPLLWVVR